MRLIDADALKKRLMNHTPFVTSDIFHEIDRCETVNPFNENDPVKHGQWKIYKTAYKCSVCEQEDPFGLTPYCRWCGAKMDGRSGG